MRVKSDNWLQAIGCVRAENSSGEQLLRRLALKERKTVNWKDQKVLESVLLNKSRTCPLMSEEFGSKKEFEARKWTNSGIKAPWWQKIIQPGYYMGVLLLPLKPKVVRKVLRDIWKIFTRLTFNPDIYNKIKDNDYFSHCQAHAGEKKKSGREAIERKG